MYYDLTDTGELGTTGVIDNVNLYTPSMIFQSLNGGVLSVGQFKTDLLGRNSNLQSIQVKQFAQSDRYLKNIIRFLINS